jgi:hypothetical protein
MHKQTQKSRKLSQLPALIAAAIVWKKETSAAFCSAGFN